MEEKRRTRRRHLIGEVRIMPSSSGDPIQAVLMNINRGGIGVYAMSPLKKKMSVVVRIIYREGSKAKESEDIPGVVCWSQAVGKSYAAGISFTEKVTRKTFPILTGCLEYARLNK